MIDTSKIHLGLTRGEMIRLFGEPDDWDRGSRKYRRPTVYLYGTIELAFGYDEDSTLAYAMDRGPTGRRHNMLMRNMGVLKHEPSK